MMWSRFVRIPDAEPSEIAAIQAVLKAPSYDCSSIAYFLKDALLTNAASRLVFRVGAADAQVLAPLLGVCGSDLTELPNLHAVVQFAGRQAFSVSFEPPAVVHLDVGTYAPLATLVSEPDTHDSLMSDDVSGGLRSAMPDVLGVAVRLKLTPVPDEGPDGA